MAGWKQRDGQGAWAKEEGLYGGPCVGWSEMPVRVKCSGWFVWKLRLETEGLGLLFVQSLNNVDVRGVVWGGDEQLWDWKAGGVWSSLKKKVEGCGSHSRWGFLEG